ncbi:MAG: von Willebrand factor type A domain-containing protein [Candidatus Sericytochromatia bacterium]
MNRKSIPFKAPFKASLSLSLTLFLLLSSCYANQDGSKITDKGQTDAPLLDQTATEESDLEKKELNLRAPAPPRKLKAEALANKPATTGLVTGAKDKFDQNSPVSQPEAGQEFNTEGYDKINENPFLEALKNPLSTFSIDVDTASYSNVRRFIQQGKLPPQDAVRIEEMVNYFEFNYPEPQSEHPFSLITEISDCPWNTKHNLLHVGLQAKRLNLKQTPPNNLVFLLDVSGSMEDDNKLPLLKKSLRQLIDELREQDSVSIVVYAGASGQVQPPTRGANKERINDALENLQAGGSTAGSAGIQLAYETARKHFKQNGNNRVILATDGDFNVGPSSDGELLRMIEEKRKGGVFLTVLGFGMGNYKDSKMEKLADAGNGNYAYIDSLMEAKKVLVQQLGGTLLTLAKDVKLQVEFNPSKVAQYRLIGYENRLLRAEDFDNDAKDAGELGAGHSVTALYEVIPSGLGSGSANDLRYQQTQIKPDAKHSDELLNLKLRYKQPNQDKSQLIEKVVKDASLPLSKTSEDFRFAAAVAGFGQILRGSAYKGDWTLAQTRNLAEKAKGRDTQGYRQDFLTLVSQAEKIMAGKNE